MLHVCFILLCSFVGTLILLFFSIVSYSKINRNSHDEIDIDFFDGKINIIEFMKVQNMVQICSCDHRTLPLSLDKKSGENIINLIQLTCNPATFIDVRQARQLRTRLLAIGVHVMPALKAPTSIYFFKKKVFKNNNK